MDHIEAIYYLTPMQEGMLFHNLHAPESGTYFEQFICSLEGEPDAEALRRAWQAAVDRHSILRTAFIWDEVERPLQVVHREAELPFEQQDWRQLTPAEQERRFQGFIAADRARGFDLSEAPLMRLFLFRTAETTYQLVWSHHHILLDGWCLSLLFREIFASYEAFRRGEEVRLERPRPFRDYVAWLQRQDLSRAETFWRRYLGGFAAPTPLRVERPANQARAAEESYGVQYLDLSEEVTARLRALTRRHQLTLNTVVQGAWALLLSRYGGQDDVLFGTVVSGRPTELAGAESMVGLFVNTLPVRVRVGGGEPLLDWLRELQATQVEARQYEYSPLVQVQGWSELPRGVPLFETILSFDNYPTDDVAGEMTQSLKLRGIEHLQRTNYPLTMEVSPGARLTAKATYRRGRLADDTVERLLGHFERLLAAVAADPHLPLSRYTPLSAAEREHLLRAHNRTETAYERDVCLHQLFERQAARTPGALAVLDDRRRWDYAETNRRANQLAHHLLALGVRPGEMVGIHLERSAYMPVAMLAILKAGAAYVPLETNLPPARIQWILSALGVRCVLTEAARLPTVAALQPPPAALCHAVCLDDPGEPISAAAEGLEEVSPEVLAEVLATDTLQVWTGGALAARPAENPSVETSADALAYVIFTSGSTGTPKGVAVQHRPVVNLIEWVNRGFGVGPADRVLFVTSLSFDLSVYDVFGLLAAGGSIRVASGADVRDPERLLSMLDAEGITFWDSAPAALQQVAFVMEARGGGAEGAGPLRLVFLSGDWIPVTLPGQLRARYASAEVVGLGGATEATVWSNFFRVGEVDEQWVSIPYGKPIQNAKYYVLDADLGPCPVGVPGDLYIGGECLAVGYANDAALTAAKFIPDPHSGEVGARLYRTGDMARFFPDGNIEFLGRVDDQVKIRGYRIEPGEVEAALSSHPSAGDVIVLARADQGGSGKRLVAYVVAAAGEAVTAAELRRHAAERLPEYMVPSAFVMLDALPLTPSGKVDRKALPAPEQPSSQEGYAAPRTPVEAALAGVWAEVLRVARVGLHDNFFELGGDSILSIQIVAKAQQRGLRITTRQIFNHPTVAELAGAAGLVEPAPEESEEAGGPAPLTPIQHWFFEQDLPDPHHWNQSVLLEVGGGLDLQRFGAAVGRVVRTHGALRLRFRPADGGRKQFVSEPSDEAPVTRVDLSHLAGHKQPAAVEEEAARAQASLNLEEGPVFRALVFDLGPGRDQKVLLVAHHLVVDGVSWRILLEDLQASYEAPGGPETVRLNATAPFTVWAERLREYAQTEAVRGELDYWLAAPRARAGRLPVDYPGGVNDEASARSVTVALDAEETEALLRRVPEAYRTQINDALLTAFAQAYARWTGERAVLLDLEGHGREEVLEGVDVSRTVGWFTAIYPLLLEADPAAGPGGALKSVKEQLRGVPHRGIGYGLLRYLCAEDGAGERLRALPPPQVSFNYLGQLDQMTGAASRFRLGESPGGPTRSPRAARGHLLNVDCVINGGRLRAAFTYGERLHRRETVRQFAEDFAAALRALVEHCRSAEAGGYTPSDFPLAHVTQPELDRLAAAGPVEDIYPLTPVQRGILYHQLLEPDSGVYCVQMSFSLKGALDLPGLERAWQQLTQRHPTLRTAFIREHREEPVQVVYRLVTAPLDLEDWTGLAPAEQQQRLAAFLEQDLRRGFAPDRAPLMRMTLFRTGAEAYQVVWNSSHLILDGWSMPLLFEELFALYEASRRGAAADLPARPPFRDYVAWLRRQDLSRAEAFWREHLKGITAPTPVVSDARGAAAAQHTPGRRQQAVPVGEEVLGGLRALAQRHRLTLNTLMLGAWALCLHELSGADDVVFGTTVSGRPPELPGADAMIGLFINSLPLRAHVDSDGTVADWLRGLQERQVEMRQYEYSPLVEVQSWSEVPRGLPLFESNLVFENYPVRDDATRAPGGLRIDAGGTFVDTAHYPLNVMVSTGAALKLLISYHPQLVTDAHARRISGLLGLILHSLAAHADSPVRALKEVLEAAAHREKEQEEGRFKEARRRRLMNINPKPVTDSTGAGGGS